MTLTRISASAGSGKTYTLTRLFLQLLQDAPPAPKPSGPASHERDAARSLAEILAATFTNKAAAEMKSRVVDGLKEEALLARRRSAGRQNLPVSQKCAPSVPEVWVERILRHYGSLNIRTIDSLLATLVRLSALELDLPPNFELSFTPEDYFTPHYDALMDELAGDFFRRDGAPHTSKETDTESMELSRLRACLSEACRSLLFLSDFKGFTPKGRLHFLLLELVERLLRGEETPRVDAGAVQAELEALHTALVDACLALHDTLADEGLSVSKNFLRFLSVCAQSAPWRPLPESVYREKSCLDECLNKASRGAASSFAEAAFTDALTAIAEYAAALPLFRHALQLAPLIDLAFAIHSRMEEGQDTLLPAPRLPGLAGYLLSGETGVSDALCRLGTGLSRLLLDEFQDTSREQWRAILPLAAESLSTGGALTLVGDVKQAIYGWRGGDARLFNEAAHEAELAAISPGLEEGELEYNWRSHPAVVMHNNAFFSLLGREDVAFAALSAMLPPHTPERYRNAAAQEAVQSYAGARQKIPPQKDWKRDPKGLLAGVRLYLTQAPTVARVQDLVRERLRRLLLEELLLHWRYGDIAILTRSGEEAALAAAWLSSWDIPVVTENSFLLASHPLVECLMAFLAFLDYPLDDLAFWEFAGGEECLGTLRPPDAREWLARAALERGGRSIPLYRLFRRDFPAAWARLIEPFYSGAGLMSAYDTLLESVKRFAVLERMPDQAPFVRRLLELAHLAESRGHSSLAAFLAFWRACKDKEKLPLPEHMDAVRIMTIHKAKGLEFPVVILPFQHKGKRREPDLAAVTFRGLSLLTRAGRELPGIYYPACITDELERLNLLYVAWTRPVYALHAFITRPASSGTPLVKALETLLEVYKRETDGELCEWENLGEEENAKDSGSSMRGSAPHPARGLRPLDPQLRERDGGLYEWKSLAEEESHEQPPASHSPKAALPLSGNCWCRGSGPLPGRSGGAESLRKIHAQTQLPPLPWRPMNWLPRLKIYRSPLPAPRFTPRQRGILAHLCLEQLVLSEKASERTRQEEVGRAVRQGLRLFPLPLDNPEALAAEMNEALLWFARLPEAPIWLARGMREQDIMDGAGRMHRVDLLVDRGDGAMHAVDYKTGQAREAHHMQVRRYMRLAGEASGRPMRGFLVYLDEKRLLEVRAGEGQA